MASGHKYLISDIILDVYDTCLDTLTTKLVLDHFTMLQSLWSHAIGH